MIIKKKIVKGIMYKPKMFINPNGKMVLKEKIVKMIRCIDWYNLIHRTY